MSWSRQACAVSVSASRAWRPFTITRARAVAEKRIASPMTAWHCCLEFYSVATRLPAEYRLSAADAVLLLNEEVFARMTVHDLPAKDRIAMLRAAAKDNIGGGRVYDSHIADVARAAGATVVITDSRRRSVSALRYEMRVETPAEFLASLKR
jgi:predicted nucleic acid-binding protein